MNANESAPLLQVNNLSASFHISAGWFKKPLELKAVQDVTFSLNEGETLGVVGESGCGKSTLGRCILQLIDYQKGEVIFENRRMSELSDNETRMARKDMQIIFQDPLASLDPRMTIGKIIEEPITTFFPQLSKAQRNERVKKVMREVGLLPEMVNRYPHEFSGGQAQRIGIARALASEPKLIVCDEPVSALDVSIQAQIINLLKNLQEKHKLALVFISHDLSIVHHISTHLAVLYLGKIIEYGRKNDVYNHPKHPYTQALISAAPIPDPKVSRTRKRVILKGELPSPLNPPTGCSFHKRCLYQKEKCRQETPVFERLAEDTQKNNHYVACHFAGELVANEDSQS